MANATVEKMKDLGIRHGEKVAVILIGVLSLVMIWKAWSYPTIDMTPDQNEKAKAAAQQNLNNHQDEDDILAKLEEAGIVQPGFEKIVDAKTTTTADPSKFSLTNSLAAPEPGAGLLRETPDLITLAKLEAHFGRGSINIIETNPETGQPVWVEAKPDDKAKPSKRRRRRSSMGGMAGMMGGMGGMGGMPGMGGGGTSSKKKEEEAKKAREEERKRFERSVAGNVAGFVEEGVETAEGAEPPPGTKAKEIRKGYRWVALTGIFDHKRLRENYAKALKVDFTGAHPHYLRVDVDRQQRLDDGTWSDWTLVDRQNIEKEVFNVLTNEEEEVTPDDVRLDELVDPLPFLEVGYWVGVHPIELVPKDLLKKPKEPEPGMAAGMGGMPGMPGMAGGENMGMMMGGGRRGGAGGMPGMPGGEGGMPGMAGGEGMGMMMGGDMGMGGMFGGSYSGPADTPFSKTEAEKIMVRSLDFTVEPDTIYRYRVRIVVKNPNYGWENVMPGVDNQSVELTGPWSDPTESVEVPPDVATYVVDYSPPASNNLRDDLVQFKVVRFEPSTGLTIVKSFDQAPGAVVGEATSAGVPDEERKRLASKQVDFISHRLLVDTSGGARRIVNLNLGPQQFDAPAQALMLRTDGMLVLRDEAADATDGEMQEMQAIYDRILEDAQSNKEKESSNMMGGYGGMMGYGPGGGRR